MIDFHKTWLPQIVGYCEMIAAETTLRRVWIERDASISSVVNFDELYEQIFDDLDSDAVEQQLQVVLAEQEDLRTALRTFLASLRRIDGQRTQRPELSDSSVLLSSPEWREVKQAAVAAIAVWKRAHSEKDH